MAGRGGAVLRNITFRRHSTDAAWRGGRVAPVLGLVTALCTALPASAQGFDVVHWWTSASERAAADQLDAAFAAYGDQ